MSLLYSSKGSGQAIFGAPDVFFPCVEAMPSSAELSCHHYYGMKHAPQLSHEVEVYKVQVDDKVLLLKPTQTTTSTCIRGNAHVRQGMS